MSPLLALQMQFSVDAARLILKAAELGYGVTLGEAYRTPEQALINAQNGTGTANSLHPDRLAIDLNLFRDGRYITGSEGHRELAAWWKSLGPSHRAGIDFKDRYGRPKPDPNHYSITPDGVRK